MTGRIPVSLLTLLAVMAWVPLQAQDMQAPTSAFYGEQPTAPQANQGTGGSYYGIPLSYQMTPLEGANGKTPQTIYRELPDDLGFTDGDTPIARALLGAFRHSRFRVEYLLWDINGPGHIIAGEQTASGVRQTYFGYPASSINLIPSSPLQNSPNSSISAGLNFTQTVNGVAGSAQSPDLSGFLPQNMNGFRGTYAVPLPSGELELSGFVLANSSISSDPASINIPGTLIQGAPANTLSSTGTVVVTDPFWTTGNPALVPGLDRNANGTYTGITANGLAPENPHPTTFISQAALLNGQLSDTTYINWDVSYQSRLITSVWGTEANYVFDTPDPNSPFQLRPTMGFRYLNFRDSFDQSGQYFSDATRTVIVNRDIYSSANNNLYGPQVSLRAEASYRRLLIGVEPKIMLGLNTWQASLNAINVFGQTGAQAPNTLNGTTFAPLADLRVYGNAAVTKYMSVYGAYNLLWTGSLMRSAGDIVYNDPTLTLNKQYTTGLVQGLSVGLEFRY